MKRQELFELMWAEENIGNKDFWSSIALLSSKICLINNICIIYGDMSTSEKYAYMGYTSKYGSVDTTYKVYEYADVDIVSTINNEVLANGEIRLCITKLYNIIYISDLLQNIKIIDTVRGEIIFSNRENEAVCIGYNNGTLAFQFSKMEVIRINAVTGMTERTDIYESGMNGLYERSANFIDYDDFCDSKVIGSNDIVIVDELSTLHPRSWGNTHDNAISNLMKELKDMQRSNGGVVQQLYYTSNIGAKYMSMENSVYTTINRVMIIIQDTVLLKPNFRMTIVDIYTHAVLLETWLMKLQVYRGKGISDDGTDVNGRIIMRITEREVSSMYDNNESYRDKAIKIDTRNGVMTEDVWEDWRTKFGDKNENGSTNENRSWEQSVETETGSIGEGSHTDRYFVISEVPGYTLKQLKKNGIL